MSKLYLCILRNKEGGCDASNSAEDAGEASAANMEAMYARFQKWQQKYADNIEDMGGKLGGGSVITEAGVNDGPFAEVKEIVGGYMMVRADDLETAIEITKECPPVADSLPSGTSVEVREIHKPG